MKRIIIIFIIVVCLLSFMGISCLAKFDGEGWNHLNYADKETFVMGVWDGVHLCLGQLIDYGPSRDTLKKNKAKFWALLEDDFHFLDLFATGDDRKTANLFETFVKIIDDLYKDPANTYISIADMCIIASRKLRGEPIESLLRELREKALP